MSANGTISYEEFCHGIKEISNISDSIKDDWKLNSHDNGSYLTKKENKSLCRTIGDEKTWLLVVFEYHLVYNTSYEVPILCFNAWKQDGSLMHVEEYRDYNRHLDDVEITSALTQLDHPVLCKPFLTIHPCKTHEIMKTFLGKSKNPIISWLSTVGPLIGLQLDDVYFQHC